MSLNKGKVCYPLKAINLTTMKVSSIEAFTATITIGLEGWLQ